jgi:hypothetical protein
VEINLLKTDEILAKSDNRSDFINSITQKIYKELEVYLIDNYEQWSGWLYIHNFFDTEDISEDLTVTKETIKYEDTEFTVSDFIHLVEHDENNIFLVKKKKYEIMRIERFLFDVLTYFQIPRRISIKENLIIENEIVGFNFIEELIEMNFLKPVL